MRTRALAILALAPVAILAACSGTPPTVELTEAYIADRSDAGTVVHVVVKAQNPTDRPLAMWAVAYSAGGEGAAKGTVGRWAQATAPAGGAVTFNLPVVVSGSNASSISVAGNVAFIPGGRFRELLNELDYPLPTTSFSGNLPVDWSAAPRAVEALRPGTVKTATIVDRGTVKTVDTLPPLR